MQADEGTNTAAEDDDYEEFYDEDDDYYHSEGHIRDFPEPCQGDQCRDWMMKIKDFRPSYKGGGGGGGGATFIFKVSKENL